MGKGKKWSHTFHVKFGTFANQERRDAELNTLSGIRCIVHFNFEPVLLLFSIATSSSAAVRSNCPGLQHQVNDPKRSGISLGEMHLNSFWD
jgi:hypothetical protein